MGTKRTTQSCPGLAKVQNKQSSHPLAGQSFKHTWPKTPQHNARPSPAQLLSMRKPLKAKKPQHTHGGMCIRCISWYDIKQSCNQSTSARGDATASKMTRASYLRQEATPLTAPLVCLSRHCSWIAGRLTLDMQLALRRHAWQSGDIRRVILPRLHPPPLVTPIIANSMALPGWCCLHRPATL